MPQGSSAVRPTNDLYLYLTLLRNKNLVLLVVFMWYGEEIWVLFS